VSSLATDDFGELMASLVASLAFALPGSNADPAVALETRMGISLSDLLWWNGNYVYID
jgi:hypothetical protein